MVQKSRSSWTISTKKCSTSSWWLARFRSAAVANIQRYTTKATSDCGSRP